MLVKKFATLPCAPRGGMRTFIATLAVCMSSPVLAEATVTLFPISIPQECFELAQREGVPILIENKYQASKAKIKLARLNGSDPLVRECRGAVRRRQNAARTN